MAEIKILVEGYAKKLKKGFLASSTVCLITSENKKIITDLIGVRVLHLFKDDWKNIHEDIINLWEMKETPQINVPRGDYNLEVLRGNIKNYDCDILRLQNDIHYLNNLLTNQTVIDI